MTFYGEKREKVKDDIYHILSSLTDKHEQTNCIYSYMKDNRNLIFDLFMREL